MKFEEILKYLCCCGVIGLAGILHFQPDLEKVEKGDIEKAYPIVNSLCNKINFCACENEADIHKVYTDDELAIYYASQKPDIVYPTFPTFKKIFQKFNIEI